MLLGGIVFCAKCGAAMTLRTGQNGRYRYYSCSARARKGGFACEGNAIPAKTLDLAVIDALEARLLSADRVTEIFSLLVKALEEIRRRAVIIALPAISRRSYGGHGMFERDVPRASASARRRSDEAHTRLKALVPLIDADWNGRGWRPSLLARIT